MRNANAYINKGQQLVKVKGSVVCNVYLSHLDPAKDTINTM